MMMMKMERKENKFQKTRVVAIVKFWKIQVRIH